MKTTKLILVVLILVNVQPSASELAAGQVGVYFSLGLTGLDDRNLRLHTSDVQLSFSTSPFNQPFQGALLYSNPWNRSQTEDLWFQSGYQLNGGQIWAYNGTTAWYRRPFDWNLHSEGIFPADRLNWYILLGCNLSLFLAGNSYTPPLSLAWQSYPPKLSFLSSSPSYDELSSLAIGLGMSVGLWDYQFWLRQGITKWYLLQTTFNRQDADVRTLTFALWLPASALLVGAVFWIYYILRKRRFGVSTIAQVSPLGVLGLILATISPYMNQFASPFRTYEIQWVIYADILLWAGCFISGLVRGPFFGQNFDRRRKRRAMGATVRNGTKSQVPVEMGNLTKAEKDKLIPEQLRYRVQVREELLQLRPELDNMNQPKHLLLRSWNETEARQKRKLIGNNELYEAIERFSTALNHRNDRQETILHGYQDAEFMKWNQECIIAYEALQEMSFLQGVISGYAEERKPEREPVEVRRPPEQDYDYDVFICHASEDKDEIARPLAEDLTKKGLRVWYDEFTLRLGDSLRRAIDHGLANSRHGVVILSPHFFKKNWPQKELDGLAAREDGKQKVILPIWHKVTRDDVLKFSPTLADKVAASTKDGLEAVVNAILEVVIQKTSEVRLTREAQGSDSAQVKSAPNMTVAQASPPVSIHVELPTARWGEKSPVKIDFPLDKTVYDLIRTIVREHTLPATSTWYLNTGSQILGPESYNTTLQTSGVRSGQIVTLTDKPLVSVGNEFNCPRCGGKTISLLSTSGRKNWICTQCQVTGYRD